MGKFTLLGVIIDSKLKFDIHVNSLTGRKLTAMSHYPGKTKNVNKIIF